ncbi:MAG: hypothetical protein HY548_09370 [Elusimicrobia bacterium]|nr:hypothetical protein [Elusimicrobiota bacterium]
MTKIGKEPHTPGKPTSKHERAGHDVTVDLDGGVLFCRTCGHPILSDAERAAPELLAVLKRYHAEAHGENCLPKHCLDAALIARAEGRP